MARPKVTAEKRFAEAVKELGLGKAQDFLDFLRLYDSGEKKSPGTDPDPKARRRQRTHTTTTGGPNDKPAE